MTKASDNNFPKLLLDMQTSSPAAPSNEDWKLYAKPDGIYSRSSNAEAKLLTGTSAFVNPMTSTGDIIYSSDGSGTPARRAYGSNGQVLSGVSALPNWAKPPGFELDYTQFTANVTISATTEATANTIVTAAALTFDGATNVMIEFYSPQCTPQATAATSLTFVLYDGTSIGTIGQFTVGSSNTFRYPAFLRRRMTPSNAAHTFSIRAYTGSSNATVGAGIGGAGQLVPGYVRITIS